MSSQVKTIALYYDSSFLYVKKHMCFSWGEIRNSISGCFYFNFTNFTMNFISMLLQFKWNLENLTTVSIWIRWKLKLWNQQKICLKKISPWHSSAVVIARKLFISSILFYIYFSSTSLKEKNTRYKFERKYCKSSSRMLADDCLLSFIILFFWHNLQLVSIADEKFLKEKRSRCTKNRLESCVSIGGFISNSK